MAKDPKKGTGKKPKGSGRRLYTDENPKDTVSIKFATPADARATVAKVKKLNKPFKVSNKEKGRGYDPVTSADKAFEKFIRKEILKKFPKHRIKGEEFGQKKNKSDFTWIIDPIDGTRSFVIGNPTWSNLISLNYKGYPVLGLANFPILKKYYYNTCLLYTSPSPRDRTRSRMPSSA